MEIHGLMLVVATQHGEEELHRGIGFTKVASKQQKPAWRLGSPKGSKGNGRPRQVDQVVITGDSCEFMESYDD
jgi:hypothetical protein